MAVKLRPMPHPSVPLVDTTTGVMRPEWVLYFKSREQLALENLSNVSTTAPSDGQALVYDSSTGLWAPGTN